MKNVIFLLLVALFSTYSCKKDSENFVFIEKPYHPESVEVIKAKVANFVAHTSTATSERTTFPNTEVNEAKWEIEAAANYLYNDNLLDNVISGTQTFSFTVPNITEGGVLKMVGTEMTNKFQELISQVSSVEAQTGTLAVMADVKLEQVTTASSQISVVVAFAQSPDSGITWAAAAQQIANQVNLFAIPVPACFQWNPSVTIFQYEYYGWPLYPLNNEELPAASYQVLPTGPYLNRFEGLPHTQSYNMSWMASDVATAYAMANQKVNDYNVAHPNEPQKYLRKIGMAWAMWIIPPGYAKSTYLSLVVAADGEVGICYYD